MKRYKVYQSLQPALLYVLDRVYYAVLEWENTCLRIEQIDANGVCDVDAQTSEIHACARSRTHTHTHTRARAHTHTHAHASTHTHTHTHTHTPSLSLIYTHTLMLIRPPPPPPPPHTLSLSLIRLMEEHQSGLAMYLTATLQYTGTRHSVVDCPSPSCPTTRHYLHIPPHSI